LFARYNLYYTVFETGFLLRARLPAKGVAQAQKILWQGGYQRLLPFVDAWDAGGSIHYIAVGSVSVDVVWCRSVVVCGQSSHLVLHAVQLVSKAAGSFGLLLQKKDMLCIVCMPR
jgi:hypothetical protein